MENFNEIESKGLLKSLVGVGLFSKIFNKKNKTKQDKRDEKEINKINKKMSKYEKNYLTAMEKKVSGGMSVRDYMKKQGYVK
tara:strand:- start:379 stop:624 length:246 start_codon:yes stop_codon:yes gene_type:complete